jgi:methylamine---glutamate N-methyltransferase subunit B
VAGLRDLLAQAAIDADPREFKRFGSARRLYHWNSEHHQEY